MRTAYYTPPLPDPSRTRKPPVLKPRAPAAVSESDRAEFVRALDTLPTENLEAVRPAPEPEPPPTPGALIRDLQSGKRQVRAESEISVRQKTQDEAMRLLENFLRARRRAGDRFVRVIHGKGHRSAGGEAVLPYRVPEWLAAWKPELVAGWGRASRRDGGSGALYVVLTPPQA